MKKRKNLEDLGLSAEWHLGQIPQIFFLFQFNLFPTHFDIDYYVFTKKKT